MAAQQAAEETQRAVEASTHRERAAQQTHASAAEASAKAARPVLAPSPPPGPPPQHILDACAET
eukprot:442187-Alexandrium_andersonii.AAC.1